MKTIICGGRAYQMTSRDFDWLDTLPITEVFSGAQTGADAGGEEWAKYRGIPLRRFPADWGQHGKAAGPIRNREMLEAGAQAVVAFPGHIGTHNMCKQAKARGIEPVRPPWVGSSGG